MDQSFCIFMEPEKNGEEPLLDWIILRITFVFETSSIQAEIHDIFN